MYQGKNLSQSVSNAEDEEADHASGGADVETDEVNSYGEEGVEDCAIMVTADTAIFKVDHTFTFCGECPDAVGRCFIEVCIFKFIDHNQISAQLLSFETGHWFGHRLKYLWGLFATM